MPVCIPTEDHGNEEKDNRLWQAGGNEEKIAQSESRRYGIGS